MKLNIGCGDRFLEGYVNIDKYPLDDSVVFGDLDSRIGLADGCADSILLDNVIEHVSRVEHSMAEVHRLLKPGGEVTIITPHFTSISSWRDPTHRHHLSYFSFDYFSKKRSRYTGSSHFEITAKKLTFGGGLSLIGKAIFIVSPDLYERHLCFVFRASTLTVILRKV